MNPSGKGNYPSSQWESQAYGSQSNHYPSNPHHPSSHQYPAPYAGQRLPQTANYDPYRPSAQMNNQQSYPGSNLAHSRTDRDYSMSPPSPSTLSSHGHGYSQFQAPAHPPSASHPYEHSRSRSFSPNQPYPQTSSSNTNMTHSTSQYTNQITLYPPGHPSSTQGTTQSRPYSCDLCALSFNRQHDLKRHRETHTGEKPYTCNGGCGKTFTRKDALKRHQLVKGCGRPED
ncbi:hypothetical protein E1B28_000696 [Marasmius oreades]|uniref:C2H2-type domain-containing protein n=1 Tax=Marasmius oreades TaxID=181124 RepID=A0A9P7V1Y8_9AGAR|nr:uncharacterized protein E1B28_000696 [Marasmius oreades]KAG7098791.1 hypothetical protein E1B28_000696 [Marasmius oreades]